MSIFIDDNKHSCINNYCKKNMKKQQAKRKNLDYQGIVDYLRNNVIYRKKKGQSTSEWFTFYQKQLKFDSVFNEILRVVKNVDKIFPINIQSFCHTCFPQKIRIRSDLFLNKALSCKLNDIFIIFSCVKIEDKKTYIVLTSNHFTHYKKSLNSSNSFFTKDFNDLINWSNNNGEIAKNESRIKHIGKITTYLYWHGNENHIEGLKDYLSVLSQIENYAYYLKSKEITNHRIQIPIDKKNQILNFYNNECALKKNNKCLIMDSTTNNDICKQIHHIVPRYYFQDKKIFDDKIINNTNNLILLCFKCHQKLSSQVKQERKKFLDYCLESMKKNNIFNNFENYLWNDLHITIPILYKIYGVDYE